MRSLQLLQGASVCRDDAALRDPDVQSLAQMKALPHEDCPLIRPCQTGSLLGPQLRNCVPRMAQDVARFAVTPGATLAAEMRDFRKAPVFSSLGFIDPYENPDRDSVITDKDEICVKVEDWARLLLDGEPSSLDQQVDNAHCADHENYIETCKNCRIARVVIRDATDVVYPDGIAKRVPHNQCRCPILKVGDFCPVHGG